MTTLAIERYSTIEVIDSTNYAHSRRFPGNRAKRTDIAVLDSNSTTDVSEIISDAGFNHWEPDTSQTGIGLDQEELAYSVKDARHLQCQIVDRFKYLKPNWDGYNGRCPSDDAINETKHFIILLPLSITITPSAKASGDGEISLFWRGEDYFVDVGIEGVGCYSYYAKIRGEEYFGDDLPISKARQDKVLMGILASLG